MPAAPILSVKSTQFILALFVLLSLYTLGSLGLGLDEAYYWYWAKHPALGYVDHPPMVAWMIGLSTALGGDALFFVRFGGFLLLWSGFAFAFATARALFPDTDRGLAWEYLLVLNLTLIFPGASLVQTIDTPLFASWMAALYFGARVVARQDARAWYGMGICLGLGMLSKYTMVLLGPGMLLFLLFTREQRHWLGRKEPWLAALLALAVFSPVLVWNLQYDWVSFSFQLNQGFSSGEKPMLSKLSRYFTEQAAIISPLLFLAFLTYGILGSAKGIREQQVSYLYLGWLSWPIILFFAFTTARGAQAEANWPAPAYVAGLLLAWAVFHRHFAGRTAHRRTMSFVLIVSLLLILSIRGHLAFHWLPIPPDKDRLREFVGWQALGKRVAQVIQDHSSPKGWFLAGDKGTTLALAVYYTGNRYTGIDLAIPQRYLFLDDPNHDLKGKNAVLLGQDSAATRAFFGRYFRQVTEIGPYEHHYKSTPVPKYDTHLYLGEGFLGNWAAFERLKLGNAASGR